MRDRAFNRFVFIDTETGGINPQKHSLLQIGLIVWDVVDGIIDHRLFFIKNDEYCITKEAQRINKFLKREHEKRAFSPQKVIREMTFFLREYFPQNTLIPVIGHNVQFDISFLKEFFKNNRRSYNRLFSHRAIDTYSVFKTLVLAGKIDMCLNSSSDAFKYFRITVNERHNALSDCFATVQLYEKLLIMFR